MICFQEVPTGSIYVILLTDRQMDKQMGTREVINGANIWANHHWYTDRYGMASSTYSKID